jgi:hypothetical protein
MTFEQFHHSVFKHSEQAPESAIIKNFFRIFFMQFARIISSGNFVLQTSFLLQTSNSLQADG